MLLKGCLRPVILADLVGHPRLFFLFIFFFSGQYFSFLTRRLDTWNAESPRRNLHHPIDFVHLDLKIFYTGIQFTIAVFPNVLTSAGNDIVVLDLAVVAMFV